MSRAVLTLDVCQESDVAAAIQAAERELGPLRGVVTCAGVLGGARVVGRDGPHDLAQFERVIRVNLVGTFNVVRLAAAAMSVHEPLADGERGVIVMTASIAAFDGQVGQAAYAASKGGVASMTLPIARELAKLGMRAVSIAPGVFATPMILSLPDEQQAALTAPIPFPRRFGNPEEFANLVEQILTNRMLNGTTIRLDGGLRMPPK